MIAKLIGLVLGILVYIYMIGVLIFDPSYDTKQKIFLLCGIFMYKVVLNAAGKDVIKDLPKEQDNG